MSERRVRGSVRERLLAHRLIAPNGCWLWDGNVAPDGYAKMAVENKSYLLHRLAYEVFTGLTIPVGMQIDHQCHNEDPDCPGGPSCLHRRCFNPDHLVVATPQENTYRGKSTAAKNRSKTHCSRGHEYTEANTHRVGTKRFCRACNVYYSGRNRRKVTT